MLTPRQVETLRLISLGKNNTQIAALHSISVATVKLDIIKIFKYLEVDNRVSAAVEAYRRGIIK